MCNKYKYVHLLFGGVKVTPYLRNGTKKAMF